MVARCAATAPSCTRGADSPPHAARYGVTTVAWRSSWRVRTWPRAHRPQVPSHEHRTMSGHMAGGTSTWWELVVDALDRSSPAVIDGSTTWSGHDLLARAAGAAQHLRTLVPSE